MVRTTFRQFLWIPPDRSNQSWSLTINGVDVRSRIVSGRLSWGLIGEDLTCELALENSDSSLNGKFSENDVIVFKMGYSGATTTQFEGEVETVMDDYSSQGSYMLKVMGSHYTIRMSDINVNEQYTNSKISDIRKDLIAIYLPDYNSDDIPDNEKTITVTFVDKSLLDCMLFLNIQGDEDCYIDHNKAFHTFKKNSKENENEALVLNDSMYELKGLGKDNTIKRNKVTVYGDTGGVPVIHVSEVSQIRTREKVVTDSYATDEDDAGDLADAELTKESNADTEGMATGMFMEEMLPGYKTYVVSPNQDITASYRVSKHTFFIPNESMETQITQRRSIAKLFKDRVLKDISQEKLVNPFKALRSYILKFDNEDKINVSASSGYILEEGVIRKDPNASVAIIYSQIKNSDTDATFASLISVGSILDAVKFEFKASNVVDFQTIIDNNSSESEVSTAGKDIQLRITISDNNARIDTVGFYWR
jgi:hypothetical protein